MSRWIDASDTDRQQSAYIIATEKNISVGAVEKDYNTAAKSNRFGTQDKPNKNVIRTWATTQEKSIQRISRPK